jgi:hypothetical protein
MTLEHPQGRRPDRIGAAARCRNTAITITVAVLMLSSAQAALPPLPPGDALAQDISSAPLDAESATVIEWLTNQGGWGLGRMQIDFSIEVNEAPPGAPRLSHTERTGYYLPDCDRGVDVPIPLGGAIEGVTGYQCAVNDCHLLVFDQATLQLFEMFQADITNNVLRSRCLAVWQLDRAYPPFRRGRDCTSADAAGLPIAPLLFDADEVASGEIRHALRFILPNARIRAGSFVLPATHIGGPSGPPQAPPYGARLRLRGNFPVATLPNEAARTVARAMQRYGIVLADGGNVALTARSDRFTAVKWANLLGPHDLRLLQISDFEMIAGGPRYTATFNCVRETLPPAPAPEQVPTMPALGFIALAGLLAVLGVRRVF